jgi:copper chaperone
VPSIPEEETMASTTLKISGMSCGHCVAAVTKALESAEGVRSARVELEAGRAAVEYDEGRTDPRRLAAVVAEEGYEAEESG